VDFGKRFSIMGMSHLYWEQRNVLFAGKQLQGVPQ
jgi:hypothetical protein